MSRIGRMCNENQDIFFELHTLRGKLCLFLGYREENKEIRTTLTASASS